MSIEARYKLLKGANIYVPQNSRICARHMNDTWSEVTFETKLPFTVNQIEDMIDLLRNRDGKRDSKEEGNNSIEFCALLIEC